MVKNGLEWYSIKNAVFLNYKLSNSKTNFVLLFFAKMKGIRNENLIKRRKKKREETEEDRRTKLRK